jgi:putative transposase
MKEHYSILHLCHLMQVSPSGFYDWQKRPTQPSPRATEDLSLAQRVQSIHAQSRQTYGSPRIVAELRSQGHRHGRKRVARLMKARGLWGRQKGRYRPTTTDSKHAHPLAPNRLAQAPKPTAPNQIWVADITYIPTQQGWLYLAAVLDLYSRKSSAGLSVNGSTARWSSRPSPWRFDTAHRHPNCSSIPIGGSNSPPAISARL